MTMIKDVISKSKYRRKFLPYGTNHRNPFLASVPWIDLIAIACFAIWIGRPTFLVPGMEVNLPEQEFSSGSSYSVSAVVSSIERGTNSMNIVFFNDKRFILNSKEQEKRLQADMSNFNKVNPSHTLILFIDKDVRYGTVVDLMELSRNAGFEAVNMSTQTK
ncbi:MAG: biopolymer transporter ExbD [Kiritimatiellae bacterium]|jgi:biopolymer transport protein ExbD|nr:biopolymer transporter ExbD [Kiritimatiellia bacterium]